MSDHHGAVTFYRPHRRTYDLGRLDDDHIGQDPLDLFEGWFEEAVASEQGEAAAMVLSTVDESGHPDGRVVLMRARHDSQIGFFTNYLSAKGHQLDAVPWAAATFYWPARQRQVRVRGPVAKMSTARSDAYFATRPRGSQLSAWASDQSQPLSVRGELDDAMNVAATRFDGRAVERPPHWGGYWLTIESIEFWQGRTDRMHDRLRFRQHRTGWSVKRLSP